MEFKLDEEFLIGPPNKTRFLLYKLDGFHFITTTVTKFCILIGNCYFITLELFKLVCFIQ